MSDRVATDPAAESVSTLVGRDLVGAADLAPAEVRRIFTTADGLKAEFVATRRHRRPLLLRRTVAMLFERPSLRTRVTFEAGMVQLGGHALQLTSGTVGWGERETIADVARNLERFVDAIVVRTGPHEVAEEFADRAAIPVINALTLREHPCQALADVYTLREAFGRLDGLVVAFVGDGNNVFHSLAITAAGQGVEVRLAHPDGYGPDPGLLRIAEQRAAKTGSRVSVGRDPREVVRGADVIYTDSWISMGQEAESAARRRAFEGFTVDEELMSVAGPAARAMHCLPAHRGEEIASDVMDGPRSLVFEQSENRLHVQKALLVEVLGASGTDED